MSKESNCIVGIDVGTTKICTIVLEKDKDDAFKTIGMGVCPCSGLRKGIVVNMESTVDAVVKSVEEAETMANIEINTVFVGIAGGHINSFNSHGIVDLMPEMREITQSDVERALESAKAVSIPMDREVLHIIPQDYTVDGQKGITNPVGLQGTRLEVDVHVVTGAVSSAQNIIKSVQTAGLHVEDIILEPLASSIACLTSEEKKSGVILIDMGGGTSDYIVYIDDVIRDTNVLAVGGDHITNDIAMGFKIPVEKAEEVKKKFGHSKADMVDPSEKFIIPGILGRESSSIGKKELSDIIEARMREIFMIVKREIETNGFAQHIATGVVITGGTALVQGAIELAQEVFSLPARLGTPRNVSGLTEILDSPMYSTGVGLSLYGDKFRQDHGEEKISGITPKVFNQITGIMKRWLRDYFQ